jgi:ligand-binding sensor domain-containing protein
MHNRQMKKYFLLLIVCFQLGLAGLTQDAGLRSWSVAEGLAQSQVYCMMEDSRGFLWFGTQGGGLSRFDGMRFINFQQRDGLVNDYILSMAEGQEGTLWFGTRDGISRFDGEQFKTVRMPSSQSLAVNGLHCDHEGRIWAATNQGLFQLAGDSARTYTTGLEGGVGRVYLDKKDRLWLGTAEKGLFLYEKNVLTSLRDKGLNGNYVHDITADPDGRIWVATYDAGVFVENGGRFKRFRPKPDFPRNLVFDLEFDDSQLWLSTQNSGVWAWQLRDSSLLHFSEQEGLADDHVRCLLVDSWDNLWMGTSGGGVSRYRGQAFEHYSRRQGLYEQIYSIAEDTDCRLWLGNADRGLAVLDGDSVGYFSDPQLDNIKVKSLFHGQQDILWVGTEGNGLARIHNETIAWYNTSTGLGGNWIRAITENTEGDVFIGKAGGGLSVLSPDSLGNYEISLYRKADFRWADRINALACDWRDRVWLGTYANGLGYVNTDSSLVQIDAPGGAASKLVRCLVIGPRGFVWAGTAGGILRINPFDTDSLEITLFSEKLPSLNIYSLLFDEEGILWAGTESGLDKVILNAAGDVIETSHIGAAEGFVGIENCQGAALRDRQGKLWFGTIGGLMSYQPGTMSSNPVPPKVSLTGVQLFYAPIQQTDYAAFADFQQGLLPKLSLAPKDNHLSFTFTGINLRNPEAVRYSWRLLGAEREWSPAGERSQATYSQLSPGEYRFQVRACNEDGVWSTPVSTPSFWVEPPLLRQTWFQSLLALGLFFLLAGGIWIYVRRLRAESNRTKERLELEKRLVELEQKALQLQMNPHFIFHALNGIQALIQREDSQQARNHLGRFSKLMRRTLQHARQSTISLEEEMAALKDYLAVEHMSRSESFDYVLKADENIEADFIEIPPMLLQPLVENALIHGLPGIEHRGKIEVLFSLEQDDLLLARVRDNGRGRDAAQAASTGKDGHVSTALSVTKERLAALGPEGGLQFNDLKDEQGKATGTEVVVKIPLV